MRAYVYGASAKDREGLRHQVEENIAWRKRAAEDNASHPADTPLGK